MSPNFTHFKWSTSADSSKPYQIRESKALEYIDWNALSNVAAQSRNIACTVGSQYGVGGRHLVREIVFDDDVHWIARVCIPAVNFSAEENFIPKPVSHSWSANRAAEMQSEIDTMAFLHERTEIPVPQVFEYETAPNNRVGAPYMLMECCFGTCAVDMPNSRSDIPIQFKEKYVAIEAGILARLWDIKFDKIGSIFKNTNTGEYEVGPIPSLGGPYSTATEYYRAWARHNKSRPSATSNFPWQIEKVAESISKHDDGPFHLIHPDFGHHNVIVDDEFNISFVIDWEHAFVGPAEMAARFPVRNQIYPEVIFALEKDATGRIIHDGWRACVESREQYVKAIIAEEDQRYIFPRMSAEMLGIRSDIVYLIRAWEERKPWLTNYKGRIEDGVKAIVTALREEHSRRKI